MKAWLTEIRFPFILHPSAFILNFQKGGAGMANLNGRVLLLNFSYEPLGTVGVARAMCMVIRGAVFVEEYEAGRGVTPPRSSSKSTRRVACSARRGRSSKCPRSCACAATSTSDADDRRPA